jgi:short-subunit dehydrogenase
MNESGTPNAPLAVVTGASSGIGRALAAEFADHGFDLVVVAEDAAIEQAASELASSGRWVTAVQVDLADASGVESLHRRIREAGRPVAAAALNAGVGVGGRFDETDLAADLRLVDLNIRSQVHLAKLLVRDMVAQGEGRLLFTSSIAAVAPGPYHATYAASKAFLQSFAQAIRTELADTGVSVTSLQPGPTETEFFQRAGMEDTKVGSADNKDDARDVARDGFEALMAGKDHVVAGSARNRVQAVGASALPEQAAAAAMSRMTKPGSGD